MFKDATTMFRTEDPVTRMLPPDWLKLREGEELIGGMCMMDDRTHWLWMITCAILAKFTAIFVICVHWFLADYRGLGWRDRLNRGIFWAHTALFNEGALYVTSQRILIWTSRERLLDLKLRQLAGVETKPLLLKGNLFIHQAGGVYNLWVRDRQGAVAMIENALKS